MQINHCLRSLASFILLAANLGAGVITLESRVEIEEEAEHLVLSGELSNHGDDMADNLSLTLEPPVGQPLSFNLGHLDPGGSRSWTAKIELPDDRADGSFLTVLRAAYQDASGYPLHSLFFIPYSLSGEERESPPFAAIALEPSLSAGEKGANKNPAAYGTLDKTGNLRLSLVPLRGEGSPARLRIVLPDSLALAAPPPELETLPDKTIVYEIAITNISALTGSAIPVAAVLEINRNGKIEELFTSCVVNIGGKLLDNADSPSKALPKAIPLILLLVWISIELRARFPREFGKLAHKARITLQSLRPDVADALPDSDAVSFSRLDNSRACLYRGAISCFARLDKALLLDISILAAITWFLLRQLALPEMFSDTLAIGGDTPAHHYLVSQLRESLGNGRIVSWAPGWWSGFPLFKFYFPLPYLAILGLDVFLPYNIAFKLGCALGIVLLPFSAYLSARILRLPRPTPALFAALTLPQLLDTTHIMWGVNIYSTMAGMISNSYSFAIFPLALACCLRDMEDRKPRLRSVLLIVLLLLSHFFTSVVLAIVLAILFATKLVRGAVSQDAKARDSALTLIPLAMLSALLMAWWILPLLAMRPWSVDFGEDWSIRIFGNLPLVARWTLLPALLAGAAILSRKAGGADRRRAAATVLFIMMAVSVFLFYAGRAISPVFVNCRLWPFWLHSILMLSALGAGFLVSRLRAAKSAAFFIAALVLAFPWDAPNHSYLWARYNFAGMEALPHGETFFAIAKRLRDLPGRVANDLHPGNEQLGSSRIFEALPALTGRPIIEGGIVNSALGSLAAYSVQGEISDNPAGWPLLVNPRSFDPATGLRRLELLGAAQFVARSEKVQEALENDPGWKKFEDYGKWKLYASLFSRGELVRAWREPLPYLRTSTPQEEIVRWFERPSNTSAPWVLVGPKQPIPPGNPPAITRENAASPDDEPPEAGFLDKKSRAAPATFRAPGVIRFRTDAIGQPHYIAMSYFPNWKVKGARGVYCAAPSGMVVYPETEVVEMRFGRTTADRLGMILSLAGLLYIALWKLDERLIAKRKHAG